MTSKEINYLRVTLESYDGAVVVRTLKPKEGVIELQIARGCENLVSELLTHLVDDEDVFLSPEGT